MPTPLLTHRRPTRRAGLSSSAFFTTTAIAAAALLLTACDNENARNGTESRTPADPISAHVQPTTGKNQSTKSTMNTGNTTNNNEQNACNTDPEQSVCEIMSNLGATRQVSMTDEQWRERLTEMQFYVTRQGGTERAFTGQYWNYKGDGAFRCICCDALLFDTATKFDSRTGWPSFYAPADPNIISEHKDTAYGMVRTEVRCANCDAHLGHVFPDGPHPTGLRYCINSAALKLDEDHNTNNDNAQHNNSAEKHAPANGPK